MGECRVFGAHMTGDNVILRGKHDKGMRGESNAMVFYDFGIKWRDCIPTKTKTADDTYYAMTEFAGPKTDVDYFTRMVARKCQRTKDGVEVEAHLMTLESTL